MCERAYHRGLERKVLLPRLQEVEPEVQQSSGPPRRAGCCCTFYPCRPERKNSKFGEFRHQYSWPVVYFDQQMGAAHCIKY